MERPVIVKCKRTAIGKFGGGLSSLSAVDLGTQCMKSALADLPILDDVDMVYVGNVLGAGSGQNMARQIALHAGLSQRTPAFTLNHVCGSGLQAIMLGAQAIRTNDAQIVIAGGVESMSQTPFLLPNHRWGQKMGHDQIVDMLIHDGLWDAFNDIHMGITAENVADRWNVSREDQDAYALQSQRRASKASKDGLFNDEIAEVSVVSRRETRVVNQDEFIRHDANEESLSQLRPVFNKQGTVTAGNASGINDGAAFVVMMSASKAKELGCDIMAEVDTSLSVGCDPAIMGTAPIQGVSGLLEKSQMAIDAIDRFEINEAFAAQAIAVQRELGIADDKLNVRGGAIALGHPIGASGARIVVTLLHSMIQDDCHLGIASLCIGGGQSNAVLFKR